MFSIETLVVAHSGLSAGVRCFSTLKLLLYPTGLAGPVSIGASNSEVESTLEGVPGRLLAVCFSSVFRFHHA